MECLFTSESVSEGHPDKISDQISDAVLDAYLAKDQRSRVACEVLIARDQIFIAGEIDSQAEVDVQPIVRNLIKSIGYDSKDKGLDYNTCSIQNLLNSQSREISQAVGHGENQGAGDQGLMFGYAMNETESAMPLSISVAHKLVENLAKLRKQKYPFLWPDSKSLVTVEYENKRLKGISTIVVSTQHEPSCSLKTLEELIREELIPESLPEQYFRKDINILVNPGGKFVTGGPMADCGLTGRKIIVDSYGGHGAHGGGAFSGKDPSKVDRTGAYAARHIAKNIVQAGLAGKCLVQLSYVIGRPQPIGIFLDPSVEFKISRKELTRRIFNHWDLRPGKLIQELNLLDPSYILTSVYGHFGREAFTWEKTDKAEKLL